MGTSRSQYLARTAPVHPDWPAAPISRTFWMLSEDLIDGHTSGFRGVAVDQSAIRKFVDDIWDHSILPTLTEYIRIPNKSPGFDPEWQSHAYMEQALNLMVDWCSSQAIPRAQLSVERLPDRTPLLLLDVPGDSDDCVLLYGHYDKQPEFTGWREGLGPWSPVREGDRLYGRGGADDGYSTFAAVTAMRALQEQNVTHARCLALIEGCEESGSYDLPFYLDVLEDR